MTVMKKYCGIKILKKLNYLCVWFSGILRKNNYKELLQRIKLPNKK